MLPFSDIKQTSIDAIKAKELVEDRKRSDKALSDLRQQLWADLGVVRESVGAVKQKVRGWTLSRRFRTSRCTVKSFSHHLPQSL